MMKNGWVSREAGGEGRAETAGQDKPLWGVTHQVREWFSLASDHAVFRTLQEVGYFVKAMRRHMGPLAKGTT